MSWKKASLPPRTDYRPQDVFKSRGCWRGQVERPPTSAIAEAIVELLADEIESREIYLATRMSISNRTLVEVSRARRLEIVNVLQSPCREEPRTTSNTQVFKDPVEVEIYLASQVRHRGEYLDGGCVKHVQVQFISCSELGGPPCSPSPVGQKWSVRQCSLPRYWSIRKS